MPTENLHVHQTKRADRGKVFLAKFHESRIRRGTLLFLSDLGYFENSKIITVNDRTRLPRLYLK